MAYNPSDILTGTQGGLFGIGGFFGPGFNIANSLYGSQQPVMQAMFSAQAARGKGPYGGQQGAPVSAKPANDKRFMPIERMRQLQANAAAMLARPDDTPTLPGFDKLYEGFKLSDREVKARKGIYVQDGQ